MNDIELLIISQLKETHKNEVDRLKGQINRQCLQLQQLQELVSNEVAVCIGCNSFAYKDNMGLCNICNEDFCEICMEEFTTCQQWMQCKNCRLRYWH